MICIPKLVLEIQDLSLPATVLLPRLDDRVRTPPPWWSCSPGPAAWRWQIRLCPRGTLFTMRCLRALSKVFVQLCKPTENIIFFGMNWFYFSFLHYTNWIALKINSLSHHAPCQLRLISCLSTIKPMCFWLVVVFLFVLWRPPEATAYFFIISNFCRLIRRPNEVISSPP